MSPRLRYARQYVLPEIGTDGQARLEAATVAAGAGDAAALEVALAYLERAGMRIDDAGVPVDVPSTADVERLAGRPDLVNAAAFLAGSLAATAILARVAGAPARVPTHVPALVE